MSSTFQLVDLPASASLGAHQQQQSPLPAILQAVARQVELESRRSKYRGGGGHSSGSGGRLSRTAIIVIVCVVVGVVALIVLAIVLYKIRQRKLQQRRAVDKIEDGHSEQGMIARPT
ncbi:hypothetical protein OC844_004192 [Tilletia horrida]|nr:hypothetical protein OC844_004192 [Tilletia horrida]